ncbi:TonB-dependent receptor [Rudanella paleaurantiibacter]|uniref:TonB-dependent receptor n=1 Tax=Rudanella paleaurantiibacter TaxID=2614655 RepID=A0A7J5TY45_9BACT|nr:TonB-dependent receptor [Rudanella paleaurantiibacter]KAB7730076.1 TonB-dependent receptor [Rudanella paleaurantiibacter]
MTSHSPYIVTLALLSFSLAASAQNPRPNPPKREGEVENQEITVEKSRRIELPPANRIFNKIPSLKQSAEERKVNYNFQDRPLTLGDPKTTPGVLPPSSTRAEPQPTYNNYVKLGAGNYGSFLGEAFVGTTGPQNVVLEGSLKHLSSGIGPVDGKNSGQSDTRFNITGKYLTDAIKLQADAGYQREGFFFYGYGRRPEVPNRDDIRQRLNTYNFRVGLENANTDNTIDYSLRTGITLLNDRYDAAEFDWGTNFKGSLGITDKVFALVAADAYVTQRTDQFVDNRNLYRVKPTFKYASPVLTITAGVNAVNETDRRLEINNTRAFPIVDIDVAPVGNVHFFAGIDGDIQRNTLRTLLNENRWLSPQIPLANTVKLGDYYGGVKGQAGGGFSFEGKVSYARYRNFYTFNNTFPDTTKFFALYDAGTARVLNLTGEVGYSQRDKFRSNLRVDFYRYDLDLLEAAWHRPRIAGRWTNSYILNKKLFVTADLYFYEGLQARNFVSNTTYKLPAIWDANVKIDYFLGRQFAAFVSLNNIVGQNYQRYLYYPVQGLNFLGGITYSF